MEALASLYQFADWGLLALRLAVGLIFLVHGTHKWAMWNMQPSKEMPAAMLSIIRILAVAEPLGAVAMFAGFLTQIAAVGFAIIMIGAIGIKKRMREPFSAPQKVGWEFDLILLAASIALVFSGAGRLSLDRVLLNL